LKDLKVICGRFGTIYEGLNGVFGSGLHASKFEATTSHSEEKDFRGLIAGLNAMLGAMLVLDFGWSMHTCNRRRTMSGTLGYFPLEMDMPLSLKRGCFEH